MTSFATALFNQYLASYQ